MQTIEEFQTQLEATRDFLNQIPSQIELWTQKLKDIEQEESDLLHYIELSVGKVNASLGYKMFIELQSVLLRRRKIKDMLKVLEQTKPKLASQTKNIGQLNSAVDDVRKYCSHKDNRKYTLRKRFELKDKLPNHFR